MDSDGFTVWSLSQEAINPAMLALVTRVWNSDSRPRNRLRTLTGGSGHR